MTRKDFQLIADAMCTARPNPFAEEALRGWSMAVLSLAKHLDMTHERFDYLRFIEACTTESK